MPEKYALIFVLPIIPSFRGFAKVIFGIPQFLNRQPENLSFQGRGDILLKMRLSGVARRLICQMSAL
jgi:hypothetical protein